MRITNRAGNPSFELNTAGVSSSSCTLALTTYAPMVAQGTSAMTVTSGATPNINTYVHQIVSVTPGEWVAFGVNARYSSGSRYIKMRLIFRNDANTDLATFNAPIVMLQNSSGGGARYVHSGQAPAGATKVLALLYLYDNSTGSVAPVASSVYSTDAWSVVGAATQSEAISAATSYFDGSFASGSGVAYGWDGAVNASSSWTQPSIELLHEWTRRWWESLPNAYRMADAVTDPGVGYFPLLRWMDGIGSLAGEMRDLSDSIWFGGLTDLQNAPESSLRWLAQLLGLSEQQRAVDAVSLRAALLELTSSGRAAVGTRASIGEAAKRFLTGEKQVTVVPSSTTAHTIVLLVRSAEVPSGNLAALAANVRGTGVVPAGHNLIAVNAVATWDSFMAAAGVTWDELDGKAKTWSQHDTLGVDLSSA
ncbi:minor tail protein [Arthrobacter phage Sicarius2]|uniref:Minor tail protein n=1 Tax=Arthrobacter phage Sicarius2 TaxID=2836090 RepID=A0A8F3INI5_9CAUD|nr:minor tail protein [Arthrobacter phage Sicarius2]